MKSLKFYLLLSLVIIINSCGANEEISNDAKTKSSTYIKKVDVDELLAKLKNRDDELASFIENNPVSNLKTGAGKTDYYLDHKNIVAVKNDKNEAAYIIPLYIKSDTNSPYLYSVSVEITDTHMDTKLVTKEPMDDGTFNYYGSSFDVYKKSSLTSKINRIDCYCVSLISDCTCHATHADGGCDHPNVLTSCNCSGGGTSGSSGVSNESGGSGDNNTGTKTSWSGGSGGATSYTPTGDGVYIALKKLFSPDIELNPLQKYTITTEFAYSRKLLDFLNEEGSTPINKAFVIQMLYNLEDGQFTSTKQLNNSIQNFKYSQKSPFDVDLSSILDNENLPENKKFIEIYSALSQSPEFKDLFLGIFADNKKFNVKFEILDHVYKNDDPTLNEVNGNTSDIPGTNNYLIKLNRKIFQTGTDFSQITIENAKTILHECIHAYLFVKAKNPSIGKDIETVLDKMYPTPEEQHIFMYNKMIPTMQKVLSEIRDLVTTPAGRLEVADLKIYSKTDNSTFEIWNWSNYYRFISLKGLDKTSSFKKDFPTTSDEFYFWDKYVKGGRTWLDKK